MSKRKLYTLMALVAGGATLFQNGCLQGFWKGFWTSGWPTDNRWLNLAIDVANEAIFG